MTESILLTEIDGRGVARVTLNRPEVHNAFNDALIAELKAAFDRLAADAAVRVVVLAGNGKSFSAGADLNWMKRMAGYSEEENFADAMRVAEMFHTVNSLPQPTVARVHGSAFAGGLGLVSVRSEEHTSELQSLMRISYAVFCLKKKTNLPNKTK